MQLIFGLAVASLLKATTALVSNGTTETVFITQTAWSTVFSCPAPQTLTVCNAQCTSPSPMPVNNANIIYQTVSDCQAGQVLTIDGTQTTLAQATTLTLDNTISNLVLNPASVTINDYTASAALTEVVYPSYTGNSGEVITCQTGVTTISGDNVVLSNCPCTVQSTVLEITATAAGAVPSAVVSSSYIVKIIYIYEVEVIVEQVPTTITTTATEVLTTVQTTTQTGTVTTTDSSSPRPTIVTVDRVTFLLRYDTTFDGVAVGGLRKRQTIGSPLISTALNACLAQCAGQADCRAASFVEDTSLCTTLIQYDAQSPRDSAGEIFAIVILRPSTPTNSGSSTKSAAPSNSGSSTRMASSTMSRSSTQSAIVSTTSSSSRLSTSFGDSTTGSDSTSSGPVSRSGSSSAPYPISNTSVSSTSLSVRSSSSSSVSVSITGSSNIPVTSQSSSSEISSSISSSTPTGSSSNPSTSSSLTSSSLSSQIVTSSSSLSSSAVLPVTNTSSISLPAVNTSVTSSASSTPVPALTGCAAASDLSDYLPAISYCSSAYPATTYTSYFNATTTNIVTASASSFTIYNNITLPTQTTAQTDQVTTLETGVTLVPTTVIDTVFTTVTVTSTPAVVATTIVARRQAPPSVQASIFESILSRPASEIALVCSCLQTPTTVMTASTETVLATTVITPIVSANLTITPSVVTIQTTETITITSLSSIPDPTTTTTTATATSTVTAGPTPNCNNVYNCANEDYYCGGGSCFCIQVAGSVGGICTGFGSAINPGCEANSDCPQGYFCGITSCSTGVNYCWAYGEAQCDNPNGEVATRRRFRRAAARRTGWNPLQDLLRRGMDVQDDLLS